MKTVLGTALLLLSTLSVSAQLRVSVQLYGPHADQLVEDCRNISAAGYGDKIALARCLGYLTGLIDGSGIASRQTPKTFPVCIPGEATQSELAKVVVKYGDDHPEYLHQEAANFVNDALKKAFPCSAPK